MPVLETVCKRKIKVDRGRGDREDGEVEELKR